MRRKVMAANWKMNKKSSEVAPFLESLAVSSMETQHVDTVLAMPFTLLETAHRLLQTSKTRSLYLAAQNLHWEEKGAFTGEISSSMLKEWGVSHVIVGHSERRQYFGETDETVARRTSAALKAGIIPIVCVGETLSERRANRVEEVVGRQVSAVLKAIGADFSPASFLIAYEPVWAIGTGESATATQAQDVHRLIRGIMEELLGKDRAHQVRILYGGSMTPENVSELLQMPDIDGGLVGGASLDAQRFGAMVMAASR